MEEEKIQNTTEDDFNQFDCNDEVANENPLKETDRDTIEVKEEVPSSNNTSNEFQQPIKETENIEVEEEINEINSVEEKENSNGSHQHIENAKKSIIAQNIEKLVTGNDNSIYNVAQSKIRLHRWEEKEFSSKINISKDNVKEYAKALISSRVVLFYCTDKDYVNDVIESIVRRIESKKQYKSCEKYLHWCNTDRELKGLKQDDQRDIMLEDFTNDNFKKESPTFIKLDISELNLLDSLYIYDQQRYQSLKKELETNNLFLFCNIQSIVFQKIKGSKVSLTQLSRKNFKNHSCFPFFEIPFLELFIEELFPNEYKELWEKITLQRGKGFWGQGETEEELQTQLIDFLEGDKEKIREAIDEREDPEYKNKKRTLIESLPFDQEPYKAALFIVSFFPNITTSDFRVLIHHLLNNQEVDVYEEEEYADKKNVIKLRKTKKRIKAADLWKTNGDEILKECNIITRRLKDGRISFDFNSLGIEEDIDAHFQTHLSLYLISQYEKLLKQGFFFNPNSSQLLIDNLYQIIVQVAAYDPHKYVYLLLQETYLKLIDKDWEIKLDDELQLSENGLTNQSILKNLELGVGFQRFLELIYHLLGQNDLIKGKVYDFFNVLLEIGFHGHLLEFIEEFSHTDRLNTIEWIGKILNSNPDEKTYNDLVKFLVKDIKKWGLEAPDKLKQIYQWLPNESYKGRYSNRQVYASLLIYEIGNAVSSRFPLRLYGEFPSKFPLFYSLSLEKDTINYFSFLITWLFNPHAVKVLETNTKTSTKEEDMMIEIKLMETRAFIIESWLLIILGLKDEIRDTLKIQLRASLIRSIQTEIDHKKVMQLRRTLGVLATQYSKEIIKYQYKTTNTESILLKLYRAKKRIVLYIKDQLKA